MSRDHQDALIEQLLRENLAGDRPRDLTPRVMALATAYDRTRRSWWISAGAAMAASIVIAIGLFIFRPYPGPIIESGDIALTNGGSSIQRGAQLATDDEGGRMTLGGYATMTVGPSTTFTLGGEKRKEVVYLEQGRLGVAVTKNRGTFDVVVEEAGAGALVHVTGTHFNVDVSWVLDDEELRLEKKMRVDVDEGSVEVSLNGKDKTTITNGKWREITISSAILQGPQGQVGIDPSTPDSEGHVPGEKGPTTAPETITIPSETRAEEPKVTSPVNPANLPAGTAATNPRNEARGIAAGRGANARGPATRPRANAVDQRMIPLRVIVGPTTLDFNGTFLKIDTYYVLNTGREFILLGTGVDDLPKGSALPPSRTRVHVQFSKGKVQSIVAIPATRPAVRPPGSK